MFNIRAHNFDENQQSGQISDEDINVSFENLLKSKRTIVIKCWSRSPQLC